MTTTLSATSEIVQPNSQTDSVRSYPAGVVNACTVDVEDYFQVSAFEKRIQRRTWERLPSILVSSTWRILELLEKHQVKATFFVLGWVARRHPDLVRDICKHGHEVGCHSDMHRLVYSLTPEEFQSDLRCALDSIQQVTGTRVTSYRSPSFSITRESVYALEILAEEGIEVDSSIYPIVHDRYGIPSAPLGPHTIRTENGSLTEFPATVYEFGKARLPVAGGGYFRFYPFWLTEMCIRSINRIGRPVNLYVHPWEFAPEQPKVAGIGRLSRFRHYVNLHRTYARLDKLLAGHAFGTMSDSLDSVTDAMDEFATFDGSLERCWQLHTPHPTVQTPRWRDCLQSIVRCSKAN